MWRFWMSGEDKKDEGSRQEPEQVAESRSMSPFEQDLEEAQDEDVEPEVTPVLAAQVVEADAAGAATAAEAAAPPVDAEEQDGEDEASEDADDVDEDAEDAEEVSSNEGQEGSDDPLGEAYCLDDGEPIQDGDDDVLPWRSDVKSPREFFSTEILYRYDILEPSEQEALKGSYRLDLKGQDGGVWSVNVGEGQLQVDNVKNEAEIVLSLSRADFMNIVNGRLNPQLAILAQKLKIRGDTRRAVIFQALLTPTPE